MIARTGNEVWTADAGFVLYSRSPKAPIHAGYILFPTILLSAEIPPVCNTIRSYMTWFGSLVGFVYFTFPENHDTIETARDTGLEPPRGNLLLKIWTWNIGVPLLG